MGTRREKMTQIQDDILNRLEILINWSRKNSLWPMFCGLSCCFFEQAAAFSSRYDIGRFGADIFRASPRQADLFIVSGTVFKKVAPVIIRLYEQMAEPKWVFSMGSCSNSGGMYDIYSVVQGVDQLIPVDIYVPGCPPRPEALLQGLTMLQEKIVSTEKPGRQVFHRGGGTQGTVKPVFEDGVTKSRDPRGPGYNNLPLRGSSVTPPHFYESRSDLMWTPPPGRIELSSEEKFLAANLSELFSEDIYRETDTSDMLSFHVASQRIKEVLHYLRTKSNPRFLRLEDLTAIDETARRSKKTAPVGNQDAPPDFSLVYHLRSYDTSGMVRIKTPLFGKNSGEAPSAESITDIWPGADWYEREVFDMFGIRFRGHPDLRRLLMHPDWEGHPLRKGYPGRATQMPPYTRADANKMEPLDGAAFFKDMNPDNFFVLNYGPHHYGTHGIIRFILALSGEKIIDMDTDIGYHHRGVEKTGEHQSWYQFLPYTDRVDYLSGVANNLPYVLAVESLANIKVPDRAQFIRVMLTEFFRLSSHLVWLATFANDVGAVRPAFYTFREREQIFDIVEMITGGRLHPSWFRIGGVARDLPVGWREAVDAFVKIFPDKIREYETIVTQNPVFKARTLGIGRLTKQQAMDWGVTGPNLRACGLSWDLRKKQPYSGYEAFDFDIPTADEGDCYSRYLVRVEEMRQSLNIIRQAVEQMPPGRYKSDNYRYTVPVREDMLKDIESLIHHFINVSRGPTIPRGEAYVSTEAPRGEMGYYVVSDALSMAYRMRIRAPGFANIQALPLMASGATISDFQAVLGSLDYIVSDIDR